MIEDSGRPDLGSAERIFHSPKVREGNTYY